MFEPRGRSQKAGRILCECHRAPPQPTTCALLCLLASCFPPETKQVLPLNHLELHSSKHRAHTEFACTQTPRRGPPRLGFLRTTGVVELPAVAGLQVRARRDRVALQAPMPCGCRRINFTCLRTTSHHVAKLSLLAAHQERTNPRSRSLAQARAAASARRAQLLLAWGSCTTPCSARAVSVLSHQSPRHCGSHKGRRNQCLLRTVASTKALFTSNYATRGGVVFDCATSRGINKNDFLPGRKAEHRRRVRLVLGFV